jgi:hypothetical protein
LVHTDYDELTVLVPSYDELDSYLDGESNYGPPEGLVPVYDEDGQIIPGVME